ncbi:ABC transporter substrate-binding protein [Metabacillus idriensis]|uniref:ABC transporter substrate-binding protein n=1 Tax=Metabacillus idriensis TaxID=324768 RepID=UPI001CD1A6FC|nr:ABC transporter substrate-binding protein [Metabacillus idriensis]
MNMRNNNFKCGLFAILLLLCAACSSEGLSKTSSAEKQTTADEKTETIETGTRTVTYLDKEYILPADAKRIVIAGSMEAMEDALVLNVKPIGASTVAGSFPDRFEKITAETDPIGEKIEPNLETILKLKPDVILGSTKFPDEKMMELEKIAPTIRISHLSSDWEANLTFMGELTGKKQLAEKEIKKYSQQLEATKKKFDGTSLAEKNVLAVRLRSGKLFIYPENVYVNSVLYEDLGLPVPAELKDVKAQQQISIEGLAEMDPDYLFVQFSADENGKTDQALEELKANPVINNIKAIKENHVFVNVIDPLAEGGPAWSRIKFLDKALSSLTE